MLQTKDLRNFAIEHRQEPVQSVIKLCEENVIVYNDL